MIFKTLFSDLRSYSKPLFFFVLIFIALQVYYNLEFARLAYLVDNHKPVSRPYSFEAFPIVVYNMYSGKIDDWNKYSYLKVEADGQEVKLTDLSVIQEDQFVNPIQKFLSLQASDFRDDRLLSFLQYKFNSPTVTADIYIKVGNDSFKDDPARWGRWLKKYLSATLHREVKEVRIFDCSFTYNALGKPEVIEQKQVLQF